MLVLKKIGLWGLCSLVGVLGFATQNAQAAKTFVYCSEGSPSTFNPQLATDGPTFVASSKQIYNRLVTFKSGTTKVIPSLAQSWSVSKNGLEYTFYLRRGIKFHTTKYFTPKRDFNVDDTLFSFNRMYSSKHPYHKVNGGGYEYFNSMNMKKLIKDIVRIDDYTIKFVLNKREAPFLSNMAMDFASILSAEYGETLLKKGTPEKIDIEPVGTGPFVFKRYAKDTLIRYKAHPHYFLGKASIDNLVISITKDPSVRYQKLKAKECHLIAEPSPTDLNMMKKNKDFVVSELSGLNVGYIAMNVQKKPFDNVLVRRAINHALNRKSYIKAIYLGNAQIANNPIPPTMWSYNKKIKGYEYSPTKALSLLKQAGFPQGFETELWTLPVSRPYNPNGKKMGEMVQADLARVGIKIKLVSFDWSTYLAKSRKGEHKMIMLGWTGDNGDPDNFFHILLGCAAIKGGGNLSRWCNKNFSQLVDKAKQTVSLKERTKYYERAQEIFNQQVPWVPLAHSTVYRGMAKNITGYKMQPVGTENFYEIDIQ